MRFAAAKFLHYQSTIRQTNGTHGVLLAGGIARLEEAQRGIVGRQGEAHAWAAMELGDTNTVTATRVQLEDPILGHFHGYDRAIRQRYELASQHLALECGVPSGSNSKKNACAWTKSVVAETWGNTMLVHCCDLVAAATLWLLKHLRPWSKISFVSRPVARLPTLLQMSHSCLPLRGMSEWRMKLTWL